MSKVLVEARPATSVDVSFRNCSTGPRGPMHRARPGQAGRCSWRAHIDIVRGDVTDQSSVDRALEDIEVLYYLVHSMTGSPNFEALDRTAAACVAQAAQRRGTPRIVYLGGLGDDDDPNLSRHLESRHEVGRVLASGSTPVTELRAAIIIGSGSASFEMLRYLVEVLPVMVAPKWVSTDANRLPFTTCSPRWWLQRRTTSEDTMSSRSAAPTY